MKSSSSSAKPLSSPGRTEKFPPPLMRFLRTNTSSKSHRARSRSSPMFIARKRNAIEASNTATTKIPEPSSPKVTCMGQVRVKRTKPKKPKRSHIRNPKKASLLDCRCRWIVPMIPRALFSRPKLSRPVLGKWASFFQLSFRRKVGAKEESNSIDSAVEKPEPRFVGEEGAEESERDEEDCGNDEASMAVASPPKNALILTRCRSAPYRSSSLARRFWESPLKNEGEEEEEEKEEKQSTETENREAEKEEEKPSNKDADGEEEKESEKKEELGLGLGLAVLTRCKSEPARTGDKLGVGPGLGFGKNDDDSCRERRRRSRRRFNFVHSLSPSVL